MDYKRWEDKLARLELAISYRQTSILQKEMETAEVELTFKTSKESLSAAQKLTAELEVSQNIVAENNNKYRELKRDIRSLEDSKMVLLKKLDDFASNSTEQNFLESQLRTAIQDLTAEYIHNREQVQGLQQEFEDTQMTLDSIKVKLRNLRDEERSSKADIDRLTPQASNLKKQNEMLERQVTQFTNESKERADQLSSLDKDLIVYLDKQKEMEQIAGTLGKELEEKRLNVTMIERQIEIISRERELLKHQSITQKEERIRLEAALKMDITKVIASKEALSKITREKQGLQSAYPREEAMLGTLRTRVSALQGINEELQRMNDKLHRDALVLQYEKKEVKKNIDFGLLRCLETEDLDQRQKTELEEALLASNKAGRIVETERKMNRGLAHAIRRLEMERIMKANDVAQLSKKLFRIKDDLRECIRNEDLIRLKYEDLIKTSKQIETLSNIVKTEKNNFLSMIQIARQVKLELLEKETLLKDEHQIKSTLAHDKQRSLEKNTAHLRDILTHQGLTRHEINTLFTDYRKQQKSIDKDDISVKYLQSRMNSLMKQMQQTREAYEQACKSRDKEAKTLLDRNDEICILYEKLNKSERTVRDFDRSLAEQDQHTQQLKQIAYSIKHTISQYMKRKQTKQNVMTNWERLRETLKFNIEQEQSYHTLFESLFKQRNTQLLRILHGKDKSNEELLDLTQFAETRIKQKQKICDDKMKLIDSMTADIDQMDQQLQEIRASNGTNDIFHWKNQDSDLDLKIMASISELGMLQQMSSELKQELTESDTRYKDFLDRIARGEAPDDSLMFMERKPIKDYKEEMARTLLDQLGLEAESLVYECDTVSKTLKFPLGDGRWTTAAPRPQLGQPLEEDDPALIQSFPVYKPSSILHDIN